MEYSNKILMSGSSASRTKRGKRGTWNEKKRAGMSFLIVIAFFAVFGLIILTEILMIDEKSKSSNNGMRHGGYNRFGESAPDYEDVKEEYSIEEAIFLKNNRFIKDNKQSKNVQISLAIPVAPEPLNAQNSGGAIPWGALLPPSIERTLPPYPVDVTPSDGSWKIVNGTRFKFFVFSAFYDRRGGKLIRVIGATKTRGPEKVWCRLWYPVGPNNSTFRSSSVMARVKIIRENWNLKYSACFVLCPIQAPSLDIPHSVSIVSKIRSPPGNVLLLRNTDQDSGLQNRTNINHIPDKIGVCVKPFHFNYDSALYLLEFLEMNSLLGVTHFTFYNHTLGPRAACVLRHYMEEGLASANNATQDGTVQHATISMLPWDLRMRSQKEIRTEGLFAALNDCLYRSMYRFQYVALIDLDEFIVPRHNDTLKDLLRWLSLKVNNRNTGAYSFQNAFFYLQFADDSLMYERNVSNPALRSALITQRKTRRRLKLHPQKQRSKYICKPESVVEAGNHFVWEFIPGRGSLNVPADAAILHHYRRPVQHCRVLSATQDHQDRILRWTILPGNIYLKIILDDIVCEFGGDDCVKTPSTVDRTAHKYSRRLTDRVELMYNKLKTPCNLLNLPPVPTKAPTTRKKIVKVKDLQKLIKTKKSEPSDDIKATKSK